MVRRIAGTSHTIKVLDMQRADVVVKAKQYGVQRVPSVVIDGQLASRRSKLCLTEDLPIVGVRTLGQAATGGSSYGSYHRGI